MSFNSASTGEAAQKNLSNSL